MKRTIQKGFTLIELMIVVAIIGILAAIAIPQYSDYTSRTRAAGAVTELAGIRSNVETCMDANNGDNSQCDTLPEIGITVAHVATRNVITAPAIVAAGTGINLSVTQTGATLAGTPLSLSVDYLPVAGRAATPWVNNGGTICNTVRGLRPGQGGC